MPVTLYSTKSNLWREFYNPLHGLTIAKIISLLEQGERGQYADLQWFYYYMERTDPMIFSIIQRRKSALLDSDWDIRTVAPTPVPDGSGPSARTIDPVLASEQAALLTETYDGISNFRDALAFLFTSLFRGYAHIEKHYSQAGELQRLEPVEQWFWVRDGMFGAWEYNENAVSGRRRGQPIQREDFLISESTPIDRMLAPLYLRRAISQRDWDAYLGVFGIPSVFLIGPPKGGQVPGEEYQEIADEIISNGRGFLPNGSDIKFVTGGGNKPPFPDHMDYIDRQITLIGTGGILTMLTESGSGTLAGNAHSDTFLQIARGDAATMSEIFQRDIDLPLLNANFPGYPVQAYFQFSPPPGSSATQVVQDASALSIAGYQIQGQELAEKTGYHLTKIPPLQLPQETGHV